MTSEKSARHIYSGAVLLPAEEPEATIGIARGTTSMSTLGSVTVLLNRTMGPSVETESHVDLYVSEQIARNLIEQLTRVVQRCDAVRDFYRRDVLAEAALRVEKDDEPHGV